MIRHVSEVYNGFDYSAVDFKNHFFNRSVVTGSGVFSIKKEYNYITNRAKKYDGKVISFDEFKPLAQAGFEYYVKVWTDIGYNMSDCVLK